MRHQIAARVPADTHRALRALASVLDTSQAEVLSRALESLRSDLTSTQARAFRVLTAARRERDR